MAKTTGIDGEPLAPTPYTPGPWLARDYKTKEGGIWIDCDAWARRKDGVLVRSTKASARCVGGTLATVRETGTEEWTVEANAALIAAAPELLEALKALRSALLPLFRFGFPVGDPIGDALTKATLAIARADPASVANAEGRQSVAHQNDTPTPQASAAKAEDLPAAFDLLRSFKVYRDAVDNLIPVHALTADYLDAETAADCAIAMAEGR